MRNCAFLLVLLTLPAAAMKNREYTFHEACDEVWKAAVVVAKTQDYRVVSINREEQILSLSVGGAWWGERMITLSLAQGQEFGCTATVQSRYSGVQHSDGPDLLARLRVQLLDANIDHDSKIYKDFQRCMGGYNPSVEKCEQRLEKQLAQQPKKPQPNNLPAPATDGWWKMSKPAQADSQK
jgi:hypothetical protein